MISDEDMRRFAELLVAWAESEISAGQALANGDDNHQRDRHTKHDRDRGMRRHKNPAHDQGDDHAEG